MTIPTVLLTILGLLLAFVVWGLLEPYTIDRQEQVGRIPGLPEAWRGKRVALISDLQVGMWFSNLKTIERIVKRIIEERPDLVLIAGDFIYDKRSAIGKAVELVRPLADAGLPTYAVLGNHDYAMPTVNDPKDQALADALEEALEKAGIRVLHNEVVELSGSEPLYLIGIGAHVPGDDDPEAALSELPEGAPRLVMMHHPASFDRFPPHTAPLAVAGHTHGGQISLPGALAWTFLTYFYNDTIYIGGWIRDPKIRGYGAEGNHLYVNRGIGFSVLPLRFRCVPELTLFTLEPGKHHK